MLAEDWSRRYGNQDINPRLPHTGELFKIASYGRTMAYFVGRGAMEIRLAMMNIDIFETKLSNPLEWTEDKADEDS